MVYNYIKNIYNYIYIFRLLIFIFLYIYIIIFLFIFLNIYIINLIFLYLKIPRAPCVQELLYIWIKVNLLLLGRELLSQASMDVKSVISVIHVLYDICVYIYMNFIWYLYIYILIWMKKHNMAIEMYIMYTCIDQDWTAWFEQSSLFHQTYCIHYELHCIRYPLWFFKCFRPHTRQAFFLWNLARSRYHAFCVGWYMVWCSFTAYQSWIHAVNL